jgi:anti-anti-sigma factor
MPVKCEEYDRVCVMSLDGDFAGEEIAPVKAKFEERLESRQILDFVVDFEKAAFIDSEGLELLLHMKRRCEEMFGQVKLANLDENLRKILEITRLEHRFECHADLAMALKTMR